MSDKFTPLLGLTRTPITDKTGIVSPPWQRWFSSIPDSVVLPSDSMIPGPPDLSGITSGVNFVLDWIDPTVGAVTLDDVCLQYDAVPTFDSALLSTTTGWGKINHIDRVDPDKTLYFRIALHNKSGEPSEAGTAAAIGSPKGDVGWGAFSASVGPLTSASTTDTGNPSGASDLQIITTLDDPRIPMGYASFQLKKDTANNQSIYDLEVVLSETLPAEGPFVAQLAAHPDTIL